MNENVLDEKQYVIFKLGVEVFGLDINKVKEIIVYREPTLMPGTSDLIEGIINLRGYVVPIYSLRKKFDFAEMDNTRSTRIVLVEVRDNMIGIIVDSVSEVLMISEDRVEKPSAIIDSSVAVDHIAGIAKMEEGMIIILDLEKVINHNMARAM